MTAERLAGVERTEVFSPMHHVHTDIDPQFHPNDQKGEFTTWGPIIRTPIQVVFMILAR